MTARPEHGGAHTQGRVWAATPTPTPTAVLSFHMHTLDSLVLLPRPPGVGLRWAVAPVLCAYDRPCSSKPQLPHL